MAGADCGSRRLELFFHQARTNGNTRNGSLQREIGGAGCNVSRYSVDIAGLLKHKWKQFTMPIFVQTFPDPIVAYLPHQ